MNWVTTHGLGKRMDKLPLVLAGPILRRTEAIATSIWIALRDDPGKLILHIYEGASTTPIVSSEATSLLKLGDALFVALLTAEYPFESNNRLQAGIVYQYDIEFPGIAPWLGKKLEDVGILNNPMLTSGGINFIAYTSLNIHRPSFSLPPTSIDDLRIIHTSCRKVHGGDGGDLDALTALDEIILQSADQPNARPHQLYFTGDQIYADDVSDTLLYMIQDAEAHIIGWQETLPLLKEGDNIRPGYRADARRNIIKEVAHLSIGDEPEDAKSHLMKLSEYYLAYLFAWSPVLWVDEEEYFPNWSDLFPDPFDLPVVEIIESAVEEGGSGTGDITIRIEPFLDERSKTIIFWKKLSMVRRALANVPIYMICDDHEVTDDWFIDKAWAEEVLHPTNLLGRRILQNAVSAYVMFQAWGNTPKLPQFSLAAQAGNTVLKRISDLSVKGATINQFNLIGELLTPILKSNSVSYGVEGVELTSSIEFSYAIDFNNFRAIVLDSRTRRFFPNDGGAPALLSEEALNNQIKANLQGLGPNQEFVLLIAPAPIIGHTDWEETTQPFLARLGKPKREIDWEAWGFNKRCFEAVLSSFNAVPKLVILSGDVHFSFTAVGKYWKNSATGVSNGSKVSTFAQLTSSAAKNSTENTNNLATNEINTARIIPYFGANLPLAAAPKYVLGRKVPARFMQKRPSLSNPWTNFKLSNSTPSTYVFYKLNQENERVDPMLGVDWAYRIYFLDDIRNSVVRGHYSEANASDPYSPPANNYEQYLYQHKRNTRWTVQTSAVGRDCIGEVTFRLTGSKLIITHALWYGLEGKYKDDAFYIKPFTVHTCELDPNDNEIQPEP
ncbi:MAG TPA: hypothetical protein VF629_15860 [Hymenobacter sp.]|jgi:hypothetical protein|uniref:hypothetical protein n=1 Tax=Hymenobacter sp. TaxID=1898978 RepID=UPI002EDAA133